MTAMWFEDFAAGQVFETAGATLSEAQILDFAFLWDPQPFHIDRAAAAESPYGGIIASGFHTMLVGFRLFLAERVLQSASVGSPGMESMRWLHPVRPGDTLRARVTVAETRPSRSRPDRGTAIMDYAVLNQTGTTVMTFRAIQLLRRRPAG